MKARLACLALCVALAAACSKNETPSTSGTSGTPATQASSTPATTPAVATASAPAMPTVVHNPSADGFIQNWLILDPIALDGVGDHTEDVEKPMFAKTYFKDQNTIIPHDGQKITVAGKDLVWRKVAVTDDQVDLQAFCDSHGTDATSCLFYGFTYIIAPSDMKAKLSIGSDDSSVWWVNGEEVIRAYSARAVNADDDSSKEITLKKGLNTLRFAVIQGDGPTGACARFYDTADKPLTNIKVSADVP